MIISSVALIRRLAIGVLTELVKKRIVMNKVLVNLISDAQGNASSMRVIALLVVVSVIGSAFYNAYLTKTPVQFNSTDWELLATVIGGKLVQNTQEQSAAPAADPTSATPAK